VDVRFSAEGGGSVIRDAGLLDMNVAEDIDRSRDAPTP
jgi:hypothetical protein